MKKVITILVVIAVLLVVLMLLGPLYILEEGEQSVVTRFGAIVSTQEDAGLKFKMPVVDTVLKYSKKILSWDNDAQRIPTAENQFIWVDTTARWKIVDTTKFYESVTTMEQGLSRLDDVIDSSVRTVIAKNPLNEAVRNSNLINELNREEAAAIIGDDTETTGFDELLKSNFTETNYDEVAMGREVLSNAMFDAASKLTAQFGIELIDILIRQIRYSDDLTESVYNRMIKERRQIAEFYRSFGEGKKAEWLGKLDNERRSVISGAYEKSETIKGKADAEATTIYSAAYGNNAEFFEFWRSIESYKKILPNFRKTLTTDMEYFKYLYDMNGN
ncbi:MAG: protease modulator HflC [Spirochaetia bacterium]|jgi:membrane protease subunit HflC|nr:protease modulator HflC [Spirochaetia bacterium]